MRWLSASSFPKGPNINCLKTICCYICMYHACISACVRVARPYSMWMRSRYSGEISILNKKFALLRIVFNPLKSSFFVLVSSPPPLSVSFPRNLPLIRSHGRILCKYLVLGKSFFCHLLLLFHQLWSALVQPCQTKIDFLRACLKMHEYKWQCQFPWNNLISLLLHLTSHTFGSNAICSITLRWVDGFLLLIQSHLSC